MSKKKEKNYWTKKDESFRDGRAAQARAGALKMHEHVAHVTVRKEGESYVVAYSVATWYLEELKRAGTDL